MSSPFIVRLFKRQLGPKVFDQSSGQFIYEKFPFWKWIEYSIMYSKPLDIIDKSKVIRKALKSETISSEHHYNKPKSKKKIAPFIEFYGIKMSDFIQEKPEDFSTFNDFFIREVKPDRRPVAEPNDASSINSIADCRLCVYNTVTEGHRLFIKGKNFNLRKLISDNAKAEDAEKVSLNREWIKENMSFANFRLAPMDYHRFHSPVKGVISSIYHIDGEYFTVKPKALNSEINVLGENSRSVITIETTDHGKVLIVPVGAEGVGKINLIVKEGDHLDKGTEMGYFDYGGSDIMVIFENKVDWDADIFSHSQDGIETLLNVNERVGKFKDS